MMHIISTTTTHISILSSPSNSPYIKPYLIPHHSALTPNLASSSEMPTRTYAEEERTYLVSDSHLRNTIRECLKEFFREDPVTPGNPRPYTPSPPSSVDDCRPGIHVNRPPPRRPGGHGTQPKPLASQFAFASSKPLKLPKEPTELPRDYGRPPPYPQPRRGRNAYIPDHDFNGRDTTPSSDHEEEIESLKSIIAFKESEIHRLTTTLKDRDTTISTLKSELLTTKLSYEGAINDANKRASAMETMCSELEATLNEQEEKCDRLTAEKIKAELNMGNLGERFERLCDVGGTVVAAAGMVRHLEEPLCTRIKLLSGTLRDVDLGNGKGKGMKLGGYEVGSGPSTPSRISPPGSSPPSTYPSTTSSVDGSVRSRRGPTITNWPMTDAQRRRHDVAKGRQMGRDH
ncbi:hypothetical protein EJ08DRAFT_273181 [Tothia fuscella]|uniref:Uncharacterized protein n=1 Tax=Tothia fuscella TaxID=1048955 RepID=A0A9P4TXD8_9PEZI|nr:hypothetical protein EJ08DRAFT_273181 [Tothia fuscella]